MFSGSASGNPFRDVFWRSLACSLERSLGRFLERSLECSLGCSLEHSLERCLEHPLEHSLKYSRGRPLLKQNTPYLTHDIANAGATHETTTMDAMNFTTPKPNANLVR